MTQTAIKTFRFVRLVFMAGVGFPLILASNAFAQLPAPAVPAEPGAAARSTAEVERVVVTGSNIPTAEETGPNPVDTYRPQDIEKLGIRNATDLQTYIPQQAGGTVNLNIGDGGASSGLSLFQKLRESGALRKKRQRAQSFGRRLRFVVRACRTEFAQQFEVVQQYLPVTFEQNPFENLPADFGRYNRRFG